MFLIKFYMYKAIFIDIDGTLRDNNKNISERTINAISYATAKRILLALMRMMGAQFF